MWWSWLLAGIGIFGIWLAGRKNLWGWAIGFGSQALWITYAVVTDQLGFIFSAVGYGWVYGRNYLRWRADAKRERARVEPAAPEAPAVAAGDVPS